LNPTLLEAERRIQRFVRLGGVDLRGVSAVDSPLVAEVHVGIAHLQRGKLRFRCSTCWNEVENDQEMEPLCTGPSWTDDHEPTIMTRIA
jgi:hypothetical protein